MLQTATTFTNLLLWSITSHRCIFCINPTRISSHHCIQTNKIWIMSYSNHVFFPHFTGLSGFFFQKQHVYIYIYIYFMDFPQVRFCGGRSQSFSPYLQPANLHRPLHPSCFAWSLQALRTWWLQHSPYGREAYLDGHATTPWKCLFGMSPPKIGAETQKEKKVIHLPTESFFRGELLNLGVVYGRTWSIWPGETEENTGGRCV